MNLSSDLLAQFAKSTIDSKKTNEETVYGISMVIGGKTYVKIDGSDLVTPVISSTETQPGERVAVLVKDHNAIITGNLSNPSAGTSTTNHLQDEITSINLDFANITMIVADKVDTQTLEAELALIDTALISKATITDLEAVRATIQNLDVTSLTAEVADIQKALIDKAEITELESAVAKITLLSTELARVTTLVGGNLTMDNIQSLVLTSSKVTVDNAFIKDAMIDRVSASKLTAGTIDTSLINISSSDASMTITDSLQTFKDDTGNTRIQIGKDTTGDFTFVLYGKDGKGQLINQNGITESAISDGLIVDKMVNDHANIAGSKLDIDSVVTEINDNGTTTIKGSKIFLDDKNQTLDISFNQLVTDLDDGIDSLNTALQISQGEINSLISHTTITQADGKVVQLKDDYSSFKTTVNTWGNTIGSLETQFAKTLKLTRTEFYSSLSALTLVGGFWIDDVPAWSANRFIWQRIVYIYSDNSETVGKEVCIQGASPDDLGAGQVLYMIEPQFAKLDSEAATPDINTVWYDSAPKYDPGKYLWIRQKLIFDNPAEERFTNPYYDASWDARGKAEDAQTIVTSKISDFQQTLDGFTLSVSDSYTTKQETHDLETTLNGNIDGAVSNAKGDILTNVDENYTNKNDFIILSETVSSSFKQTSEDIVASFDKAQIYTKEVDGKLQEFQDTVGSHIRFSADGIDLGRLNSPFTATLDHQQLAFKQDGVTVAYVGNNKLYITEAEIIDSLRLGNATVGFFTWVHKSDGNLCLKWSDK